MSISVLVFMCVAGFCLFVYSARGAECEPGLFCSKHVSIRFTEAAGGVDHYQVKIKARAVGPVVDIDEQPALGPESEESPWITIPEPPGGLFSGLALLALLGRWRRG